MAQIIPNMEILDNSLLYECHQRRHCDRGSGQPWQPAIAHRPLQAPTHQRSRQAYPTDASQQKQSRSRLANCDHSDFTKPHAVKIGKSQTDFLAPGHDNAS